MPATDATRIEPGGPRADGIAPGLVERVAQALGRGDEGRARALIEPLHPADIAQAFALIDPPLRPALATALGDRLDADVLAEMNDWVRDALLDALSADQVAGVMAELDTDDAVAMIEEMDDADQRAVLDEMEPDDRAAIEAALAYPEDSAGRLMQRELVAVPEHWSVGRTIDHLRGDAELATDFWEIFVVDERHMPVGTMRLSWLLRAPRDIGVGDVMQREQTLIPVAMDQEQVALRFQRYALISAAVVDPAGRLVGMITVDDIVHIIAEEAGEDILRISGAGDGDINEPVGDTYRARVRWLTANLGTAIVSSSVVAAFQGSIAQMVALAVLMPIVASIGGNAGTQTMAVAIRGLATGALTQANTVRHIGREIRVALLNGLTIATLLAIGTFMLFANPMLSGVIAAAVLFNILVAGLAGVFVPLGLKRAGIDPAIASSVLITMVTDTMGFLGFLGLATASGLVG